MGIAGPDTPESDDTTTIIIVAVVCVLVYLACLIGVICFLRSRNKDDGSGSKKAAERGDTELQGTPTQEPSRESDRPVVTYINPDSDSSYETESEEAEAAAPKEPVETAIIENLELSSDSEQSDLPAAPAMESEGSSSSSS